MRNKPSRVIPIFFAVDNDYVPFLAVALQSMIENSSKKNTYVIKVLYTDITKENQAIIKKYEQENFSIEFVDLNKTTVTIPDEAIKSSTSLDSYLNNNTKGLHLGL